MRLFINLFFCLSLVLVSCKKEEETNVNKVLKNIQAESKSYQANGLKLMKSERTGDQEISLLFSYDVDERLSEISVIKSALIGMVGKMIWSNAENKKLFNEGINFRILVQDQNEKIVAEELMNKSNMNGLKPGEIINPKHNELQKMLEVYNGNLPITDSVSGVKITMISLGKNSDVVYTAVVPNKLKDVVKRNESKNIIKSDMSKDQQLKKVLNELLYFDIKSLKYQYRDNAGKLLQEIEMHPKDFK